MSGGEAPFKEEELLPISGLNQLVYCERRFALIHLEQEWAENRHTVEGRLLHERTDEPGVEMRGDLRVVRALPLRSLRLGIGGVADVVEFHREDDAPPAETALLQGVPGRWRPFPVEYKKGRPKRHRADEVQVAAQALCLEEMLGVRIRRMALFYGKTRRRTDVLLDESLRSLVEAFCVRMHAIHRIGITPPAVFEERKCGECSLFTVCEPKAVRRSPRASDYLEMARRAAAGEGDDR